MAISFFSEDVSFSLSKPRARSKWIKDTIACEGFVLKEINYIFCSDAYLSRINLEYLNHKSLTDIITFDNSEEEERVEGDIFVSVERVKENAASLDIDFEDELDRVLIHGVLHLVGYKDKAAAEKRAMRNKEDRYLSLRAFTPGRSTWNS